MTLSEEWLRWGLALVGGAAMSGAVSLITTSSQLGFLDKRIDLEAAQIREILREREKVERLTIDGLRNELEWVKASLARLDRKAGFDVKGSGFVLVRDKAPEPSRKLLFDDELRAMREQLDIYVDRLKEGKLNRVERDRMYSLEIDYEIKRGWQIWCETNQARRLQCEKLFSD